MSKYDALWKYVSTEGKSVLNLSFAEIEVICGVPIDHSFLNYKKELKDYGYEVEKISLREKNVLFRKMNEK